MTVTAADWVSEPEVPVTIRVTCCAADIGGVVEALLPLLHPTANSETTSSKPSKLIHRMFLRVIGFLLRVVKTVPNKPRPGSRAAAMPGTL